MDVADWKSIYLNEEEIVSKYHHNKDLKIKQPPGYTNAVFDDINTRLDNKLQDSNKQTHNKSSKIQNYELIEFKKKKMWELAISPAKNILMNFGMNYMSPNEIQVIPIMMLFMLFINNFQELFQVNSKFNDINSKIDAEMDSYDLNIWKLIYILSVLGNLGVGVWKLFKIGLIPNSKSDWISWESILSSTDKFV